LDYLLEKTYLPRARERQTRKFSKKEARFFFVIVLIPVLSSASFFLHSDTHEMGARQIKSNYVIQNLQGDVTDTWLAWNIVEERELQIQIINKAKVPNEKLDAIKNTILSTKTVQIDDSLLHKGPEGSTSTYYEGWKGAAMSASQKETVLHIPTEFRIVDSKKGTADITIELTSLKSGDGYSGFTKSISDENHILLSHITIYEADKLTEQEITAIVRHEFGHALGLAHSTAPEDLMAPTIQTAYPYISDCDVDALYALYNGNKQSQVVCEK
jgi:hypothetical protein